MYRQDGNSSPAFFMIGNEVPSKVRQYACGGT